MMNREQLLADFSPFADIGENAPRVSEQKGKVTVSFVRDGRELKLTIDPVSGAVQSTQGRGAARKHSSISTLLASDLFANLRRWADVQRELLARDFGDQKMIPINAKTHSDTCIKSIDDVSRLFGAVERSIDSTEVLLVDGPAGIGKTNLISQLALARAVAYKTTPVPLVLHIKSRGRVLSNLEDLMAFSLQTIRSSVTYDQIPVLLRYGLIIAAIDGFDELGDPNGYDTAWAQLSELISSVRGGGSLILAGRDTFISRTRLLKDVSSLRDGVDVVHGLTLLLPSPQQAKEWLMKYGWTEANFLIPSVSVLLEDDSFALRPVFLKLLAEQIKPREIKGENESFLTPFLLRNIVARESKLFGRPVQNVIPVQRLETFVTSFMLETAREMADMQTESLDGATLSWIAEAALGDGFPQEIVGLIKNRASVIALLVNDERPGHKAFVHTHIQNYYLARVAVEAISRGDTPKFIRRNILGAEFLSTFVDVVSECASLPDSPIRAFVSRAQNFAQTYPYVDRGARNLGALLLASLHCVRSEDEAYFAGFQVDDAVTRGTAGSATIDGVIVNQLDCRQADLGSLVFKNSSITSLIADDASRFPPTMPLPKILILENGLQVTDADKIAQWLDARGHSNTPIADTVVPDKIRGHRIYALLGRVCRMHRYWLRQGDGDIYAEKILKDEYWPVLSNVLNENGFLRIERRAASGGASPFYHVKDAQRLLSEKPSDVEVVKFFSDLAAAV